jgi:hypothetical protein
MELHLNSPHMPLWLVEEIDIYSKTSSLTYTTIQWECLKRHRKKANKNGRQPIYRPRKWLMDHMGKHVEMRGKYTEGGGTRNYYGTEKVYIFHLTYGPLKLSQLHCPNSHVISIRHSRNNTNTTYIFSRHTQSHTSYYYTTP